MGLSVPKQEKSPIEARIDSVLSDGSKLAIVLVAHSFRFGGNWAFIKNTDSDYKAKLDLLKEEKGSIEARPLSNGALILMNRGFLTKNVNAVIPNAINNEFVSKANSRKLEEQAKYTKFVESVLSGKSKYLVNKTSYQELVLGTYCINDTNLIKVNGVEYPSYKLSLDEMLGEIRKANLKYKRQILVKVANNNGFGFMRLESTLLDIKALHKGLEIADSNTGVFVTLRLK